MDCEFDDFFNDGYDAGTECESALKIYLKEMGRYPLLKNDEIIELFKRIEKGEYELKNKVIESNLRLVVKVAREFNIPSVELEDIIQEGNIGLIKAVEGFDYNNGCTFSTYAIYWIRQKITRYIDDKSRLIRIPVYLSNDLYKVKDYMREFYINNGVYPDDDDISRTLRIPVNRLPYIRKHIEPPASLDARINEEHEITLGEVVEDGYFVPEDMAEINDLQEMLNKDISKLPEREQVIIVSRFELGELERKSFVELGKDLGCSRERIRQLERDILIHFRKPEIGEKYRDYYA